MKNTELPNRQTMKKNTVLAIMGAFAAAHVHGGDGGKCTASRPDVMVSVVQDVPGYNSWPVVQTAGNLIICGYGRGVGHTVESSRGAFVRTSGDGGRTWGEEVCITNAPDICEGVEGGGRDGEGNVLFWMNCRGHGRIRHELYRTNDGVHFERISCPELNPEPVQVTGIFPARNSGGDGLMALWFAGDYTKPEAGHSWGTLFSTDGGATWTQRTVERDLHKSEWPTEICAAPLGDGRIIAIGRSEDRTRPQFQLTSTDGGVTWAKSRTNIGDICESTPALVYDGQTGIVHNYYYQRGPGILWRRSASAESLFSSPCSWPEPVEIARGGRWRPYDSGNVTAVAGRDAHYLSLYSGDPTNTAVYFAAVPATLGVR